MDDSTKTKAQLISELKELRKSTAKHEPGKNEQIKIGTSISGNIETISQALESIPMVIALSTVETGKYLKVNKAFEDFTGYSRDELIGHTSLELNLWANHDDRSKLLSSLKMNGFLSDFETQVKAKSNEVREVLFSADVIKIGTDSFLISTITDITERKKAEEALKEQADFIDKIIESSALSTWISDADGTAIRTNPACLEFFGATKEDVIGKYNLFNDNVIKEQGLLPDIENVFRKGRVANIIIDYNFGTVEHIDSPNATHKIVNSIFTPILDSDGNVTNVIVHTIDLTDIKQAEEQIKASLLEKEILLKEVYHRVKNNLAVVSSLLAKQAEGIEDKQYVTIFNESINRIQTMSQVHEILYKSDDFSRINFEEYTNKISSNISNLYIGGSKRISFKTDIKDVYFNLDQSIPCGLIINELISNAYKHAFPGKRKGEIKVSMKEMDDKTIELIVSDNGIGLPKDLENNKPVTMGMNIVNLLVMQLEGEMKRKSTKNNGTEFRITFKR